MKGLKGVSPLAVLALLVLTVFGIAGMAMLAQLTVQPTVVKYDGEFDDAYLATKGWFYSDFTEQVDCNISNDVLGGDYSSCVYRTIKALNATADSSVNSRDFVISLVIDLDGDVKDMEINGKLGNGVASTGKPADDIIIKEVKLYTHEDNPRLVKDLTGYIEDQTEIDANTGPLSKDEYVLYMVFHTKTISPDFTTGDDIMRLEMELDTEGDVDTAKITLESA
ncbi:MAG: hypothetical protein DRP16_03355 [Candidatus Aenigmatarchaeota archaeon]|nr:MAG: hypothetical protein DRP16_03355 [Candidatus Aenigmarchaeota archaeon]